MSRRATSVLLCEEDRHQIATLVVGLSELGHSVTVARTCADAFDAACRNDFGALVAAPSLRDGTALMLPRALGIRRPRLVVLVTRLGERLAHSVVRGFGFDAQFTKILGAERIDQLLCPMLKDLAKGDSLVAWTSPR